MPKRKCLEKLVRQNEYGVRSFAEIVVVSVIEMVLMLAKTDWQGAEKRVSISVETSKNDI